MIGFGKTHKEEEPYEKALPLCTDRQRMCVIGLHKLDKATANELAMYCYTQGKSKFFNRNLVHPRLNELVDKDIVVEVGKKADPISGKLCTIYSLKDEYK
jgi:hypothetical protein